MYLMLLIASLLFGGSPTSIYDWKATTIDGKEFRFDVLKGKKILIINTASRCGFTPQYEELEALFKKYNGNLAIIGFPANNFGGQEPGSNEDIAAFCQKNYGVTFLMMSKVSVKGDDIDELFKWMNSQPNPDFTGDIKWNFEKFLFDESGNLIHRFRSNVSPMDPVLVQAIESK
jgi:glutathione peroxidase